MLCSNCPVECSVCDSSVAVRIGDAYFQVIRAKGSDRVVEINGCNDPALSGLPPVVETNVRYMLGCTSSLNGYLRLDEIYSIKSATSDLLPEELLDEVLFFTTRQFMYQALRKKVVMYAVSNCLGNKFVFNALSRLSLIVHKSRNVGVVDVPYTIQQRDEFCVKKLSQLGVEPDRYRELRRLIKNPAMAAAIACTAKLNIVKCAELFGVTEQEIRSIRRKVLNQLGSKAYATNTEAGLRNSARRV